MYANLDKIERITFMLVRKSCSVMRLLIKRKTLLGIFPGFLPYIFLSVGFEMRRKQSIFAKTRC